ncbi:MAG: glucuronate isomerase [Ruminococcaceae bacterium]|nr:glucuronate isomerase [Oscillospiraceae bacterium]
MTEFMTKDFLLKNETAKSLYHCFADSLPIIDYHCHVSPKEIYEDKHFSDISEVWLSGDHYKWRLMRSNGVDEYYITGDAPAREKFQKFAEVLYKAIGNPMYHWCHLELKKYFGYEGILNADTAEEVWQLSLRKLSQPDMGVRGIIEKSGVAFIGTTDDPIDSLEYHKKIRDEGKLKAIVAPSFRPDKAFQLNNPAYASYIEQLEKASGKKIEGIDSLKEALADRMEYFASCGCKASDHGLNYIYFEKADYETLDSAVKKALRGEACTQTEVDAVGTELLLFCAENYKRLGWVMQLHYNCLRNPNNKMFSLLGPDTGFDVIGPHDSTADLAKLLDSMYSADALPRTILYSLDSKDNSAIDTMLGAFQQAGYPGTIQHGSAWWFNDTKLGMEEHLRSLASLSLLGNFVGMLTDSRSFLSYTRHEYFRRILCNLIGTWVEEGEYPDDANALREIVKGISFYNAKRFFGLEDLI